nr:PREDICTED: cytochrome P450 4V2-like [Bemisia tabaci]
MRKMINPSFRANVLTSFDENFRYHTNIFVNLLRRHENSGPFDIFLPVHLCTIDLIFDNMMESRVDVQKNNFTYLSSNLIAISEMVFERAFAPLLWPDWIYRLSGMQNLFDKLLGEEKSFLQEMLERRIVTREAEKLCFPHEKLQTFIEIMLRNLDSGSISKDRVLSEMTEMFIAGSISTAITNAWVFKMLAMFPAIQDKAYQEIIENCDGTEVTPENLSNLFYLEMIIKETLRHFTIPVMGRRITEDLQVNEELIIPAGIQVFLCTYALHHETIYWQKPGEFYPEHFSSENEANRPKGAFVPFLSGPRGCPGHHYAMKSIKFIVANTILKYHFSTDEKPPEDMRDLDYRLVFMIWPATGFEVKIKRR